MIPILKESFLLLLVLVTGMASAQQYMADGRLHLPPAPASVAGVTRPVQSLDGSWEVNLNSSAKSVTDNKPSRDWQTIQVPGEARMQGFKIKHDAAFVYRRKIKVHADTSNKRQIIRFNGVFNHAKVYCNGHFVREHFGGFTAWDADITRFVKPGQDNWLHVSVIDRTDDISYASGYAAHPIGGITRKVQYIVLPRNPVQYLYANAGLSDRYTTGVLSLKMQLPQAKNRTVIYTLTDAAGNKQVAKPFKQTAGDIWSDSIRIGNIKTWTAENPYLYTLTVTVFQNGKPYETIVQPVGFRSVEINKDNEMLVNGSSVKLRGACRHDMHPLLGRSTNRAQDSLDVLLAKEANMNFIRTSHYPPSEDFLEFCDRYGIYVQEETAICFVLDWRSEPYLKYYKTMDDPAFTGRYLGQLSEMIDRDRNHAAVIMWSIGNESWYGANFQKEYDFIKAVEPTRPISWSFPTTALNQGKKCFDILVSHYPKYNGYPNTSGQTSDLGKYEKNMKADYPIIGDEWAHVSCYNTSLTTYDPNAKDAWGKSLDSIWMYRFDVKGYLGGAVWGMIDETFMMKDTMVGYGPWGIVDVWRRKKAEFWNTKKAYSPIRLDVNNYALNALTLSIPVHNRFDHTSLKAIAATVTHSGGTVPLPLPDVLPHQNGVVSVPVYATDSSVLIRFNAKDGTMIDEERIFLKSAPAGGPQKRTAVWTVDKKTDRTLLKSSFAQAVINGRTGAIETIGAGEGILVSGNPVPVINRPKNAGVLKNTEAVFSGGYKISTFRFEQKAQNEFVVYSQGLVDSFPVTMTTTLYADGRIGFQYTIDNIPDYTWDIGIGIPVVASLNEIRWRRKGYWSTYPEGHLAAVEGRASKTGGGIRQYGVRPRFATAQALQDFELTRETDALHLVPMPATEMYRAKKEHIYQYGVWGKTGAVEVWGNGAQAAKMNVWADGSQQLLISDKWDYWTLSWGNYQGTRNKEKKMEGHAVLQLKTK